MKTICWSLTCILAVSVLAAWMFRFESFNNGGSFRDRWTNKIYINCGDKIMSMDDFNKEQDDQKLTWIKAKKIITGDDWSWLKSKGLDKPDLYPGQQINRLFKFPDGEIVEVPDYEIKEFIKLVKKHGDTAEEM